MNKNLLDLTCIEVKEFFLSDASYFRTNLPPYIKFKKLISSLVSIMGSKKFYNFSAPKLNPGDFEGVNYKLLNNKNGKYDWRPLELIHPVIYISLVNEITEATHWKTIVRRLKGIQKRSYIQCVSMPTAQNTKLQNQNMIIKNWWENVEQESLKLSLEYSYMYQTDIMDCYGSMYTHSIPWALHSKHIIKWHRSRKSKTYFIGNEVDKHIQAMSNSQTNGIPQGSVLMDFIAEIVLNYADLLLTAELKKQKISPDNFKILRYRDDYRVFVNNPTIADKIIKSLTEILIELGLKLNSHKTTSSNNVIGSSIKADKLEWLMSDRKTSTIQKQLLIIHNFSKTYPNSGTIETELHNVLKNLYSKTHDTKLRSKMKKLKWSNTSCIIDFNSFNYHYNLLFKTRIKKMKRFLEIENVEVLVSIIVDIAFHNPRTYPISMALLSELLSFLDVYKVERLSYLILEKFKNLPNIGYLEIWLQRAIVKSMFSFDEFNENICKLVSGQSIELWNNEWLNSSVKSIIQSHSIVDNSVLTSLRQTIQYYEIAYSDYN